jgi:dihydrofolate reductase
MRKIILFMHMSLDGFIAKNDGAMDWVTMDDSDGLGEYMFGNLWGKADAMILGRVLYKGFEQAWPAMGKDPTSSKEIVEFAKWIENAPKYVFSNTLEKAEWNNSHIVRAADDAAIIAEIKKFRMEPGGDILLFGGASFSETVVRLNLVDEYRLKLEPIILGTGRPLFKDLTAQRKLHLVQSKSFSSGVVALFYAAVI